MRYVYVIVTPLHNFRRIWAPGFVLNLGAFSAFVRLRALKFQNVRLSLSLFIDAE